MNSGSPKKKSHKVEIAMNEAERKREVKNKTSGRKKTSIACIHCWKSKTRCSIKRPCERCLRLKKECYDRPECTRKRQNKNINIGSTSLPPAVGSDAANQDSLPPPITFNPSTMDFVIPQQIPSQIMLNNPCSATIKNISPTTQSNNTSLFVPSDMPNFRISDIVDPNQKNKKMGKHSKRNNKKKTKKRKHAKKRSHDRSLRKKRKKRRKKHKQKEIRMETEKDIDADIDDDDDDEPPLKRQKLNSRRSFDGSSESSHYSTDRSEDDDDDELEVIISIKKDKNKKKRSFQKHSNSNSSNSNNEIMENKDVWSHYTFSRGSMNKIEQIREASRSPSSSSQPIKREKPKKKLVKKEKSIDVERDLAAILSANKLKFDFEAANMPSLPLPNLSNLSQQTISPLSNMSVPALLSSPNSTVPPLVSGPPIPPIPAFDRLPTINNKKKPSHSFNVAAPRINTLNMNNYNVFNVQNVLNAMNIAHSQQSIIANSTHPITRITSLIPGPSNN